MWGEVEHRYATGARSMFACLPVALKLAILAAMLLASMVGCTVALADYHVNGGDQGSPDICRQASVVAPAEAPGSCVPASPVVAR